MRKPDFAFWTFMIMAGIAGVTTVLNVSRTYSATSPNSEIYRQLDLFGDVLERQRRVRPGQREQIAREVR